LNRVDLFPSSVWIGEINVDNEKLKDKIYSFKQEVKSAQFSNQGGYQGHNFHDSEFIDALCKSLPMERSVNFMPQIWVNINKKGDYNGRHAHTSTSVILSGTYYVSVPENSGGIRFWDPRGVYMASMPDHIEFHGGCTWHKLEPKTGMLLFFPSWLEHDVEPNMSDQDRISISFNIMLV